MNRTSFIYVLSALLLMLWGAECVWAQDEGADYSMQEEKTSLVDIDYGVQIKSRHVWNGGLSYNSWNMQPDFTVSIYGFYFNAWACVPFGTPGEVDLTLGYEWRFLSFGMTDVFYPNEETRFNHFFTYRKEDCGEYHQGWATAEFTGVEKFPIAIKAGMFVYGDAVLDEKKTEETGKEVYTERYSTYLALAYSHTLKTGQTLAYEVGMTPFKGFFADHAHVVNISCKVTQPLRVSPAFTLDLTGELVFNPAREALYFVAGISF